MKPFLSRLLAAAFTALLTIAAFTNGPTFPNSATLFDKIAVSLGYFVVPFSLWILIISGSYQLYRLIRFLFTTPPLVPDTQPLPRFDSAPTVRELTYADRDTKPLDR